MRSSQVAMTLSRVLLLALMALAPVALGRLQPWETLALLLTVSVSVFLWVVVARRRLHLLQNPADYLLWAGLLLCVAACWRSVSLYESLLALALMLSGLLVFALARQALAEDFWRRLGWYCLVAGAAAAGLWGLREYLAQAHLAGQTSWRAFGSFYNPNCLGGYLALLLPVPIALVLGAQTRSRTPAPPAASPGKRKRQPEPEPEPAPRYPEIIFASATLILGLGLLVTGSKGGLLAALVGVLLFALLGAGRDTRMGRLLRWASLGVVLAAILAALFFPPIHNRLVTAFSSQQSSSSFRVWTWKAALHMVAARPLLGFGPGTFSRALPAYALAGYTRQAHQTPLQLASENGIPATALFLGGIAATLWILGRRAGRCELAPRLLVGAAVGAAVGFWVHNLVDYTFYLAAFQVGFWGVLGLAMTESAADSPAEQEAPVSSATAWSVAVVSVLLTLAAGIGLASEINLAAGRELARMGATGLARQRLERVLPLNAYRWAELSRLEERDAQAGDPQSLQRALDLRRHAAALQPTEPSHWLSLGRLQLDANDLKAAEETYRHCLELQPTSTIALAALAETLDRQGKHEEALATYRRLADLYDTPVRTAQAVEFFIDESYVFAWLALGRDAAEHGDYRRTAQEAQKAIETADAYLNAQKGFQEVLGMAGQYDPQRLEKVQRAAEEAHELQDSARSKQSARP
ncbi:MAG: O-antigen ligase family protein [Armatimonadia bacterium]